MTTPSNKRTPEQLRAAAEIIAAKLRDGAFQQEAALAAGIPDRQFRHYLWESDDPEHLEFQQVVGLALYEQAHKMEREAMADIGSAQGGSGAWATWHKWRLEKRFRKIFGDLSERKIELSGPDGGPMQHSHDYSRMSDDELKAYVLGKTEREGESE